MALLLGVVDYSSIPQKNTSAQLAAIDSIANYAALSKYFIVVAPETIHCNTGLRCNAQTYLGRGWCRLEQWAGMSASTKTDHMYLYEAGDLHRLSDRQSWIEESVNVFTGNFTCNADKQKLVDVVMSLYAFCISCGRYKRSSSTKGGDSVAPHAKDGETGDTWLSALIDRNRKHMCVDAPSPSRTATASFQLRMPSYMQSAREARSCIVCTCAAL